MTHGIKLSIGNYHFTSEALKKVDSVAELNNYDKLSSYAQQSLEFCQKWLNGQKEFRIHTSGSTGTPKEILITREQMTASAHATAHALSLQPGDTALVCLNTEYIAGKMMLVRGLEIGIHLVIVPPSSMPLASIQTPIDFCALVPLQLNHMLETENQNLLKKLNLMRAIIVGGAAVSFQLEQRIQQHLSAPVYSTYGMTETVSHIALKRLNGEYASDTFRLLPGVEVRQDERHCLSIRGTVSQKQWIQTNDIVELLDKQHFRWLGRADHVINSGGVKIYAEQLEARLQPIIYEQGFAEQYFVAPMPDEKLGEKLCLILQRKTPLSKPQTESLYKWMRENLHPYQIPKEVFYVAEFSSTPTGKVQRASTLARLKRL
ncbi:AMP-binding protein [Porifericola rhodea]|uniref:AMP-binding protein n=1 Tax=Porifericola rhodea TaxID=930972 RepID=UPI002665EBDD|nr:AMP-binding protein [Porifericola rhodea]WKN33812.1 AMP-binding protein [Porifericola rhodea]